MPPTAPSEPVVELNAVLSELVAVLEAERDGLRAGRLRDALALADRKAALLRRYGAAVDALRRDDAVRAEVKGSPSMSAVAARIEALILESENRLERLVKANQRLIDAALAAARPPDGATVYAADGKSRANAPDFPSLGLDKKS